MVLASPPGAQPEQARESPESHQRCCIVSQTVLEFCIDGWTGHIAKPAVHHVEVSPIRIRSLGGHRRDVPAGRRARPGPNFTSFFLWREDPTQKLAVHQYTRHIFGAKDSPTCANYALQRTADDNCKESPREAGIVRNNFYMDDYLESFATSEEATEMCQDLVTLLKRGGFKLTKFVSKFNLPPSLPPLQDQSSGTPEVCELSSHVLGLKWNQRSDTLVVSRGVNRLVTEPVTQRLVLSRVASIFDPIGLVAPYTIKARLVLKEV